MGRSPYYLAGGLPSDWFLIVLFLLLFLFLVLLVLEATGIQKWKRRRRIKRKRQGVKRSSPVGLTAYAR